MPQPRNTSSSASSPSLGSYTVVGAGLCYAVDGDPANIGLGLRGQVIQLTDDEALRLITVGAVTSASEEDVAADAEVRKQQAAADLVQATGPLDNPYGGRQVSNKTLEEHAEEEIARAHKVGVLPPDAKLAAKK